jgi:phospholipid/cholesterol/gamma-HCH transport system substrate-binding protein
MRRLIAIALLLIAVPLVLVFGIAARGSDSGGYKVRAIFDFVRLVPGEDVKIAGAKVGKVESLDVTPDKKAAVVLSITKDGFTPFHADAQCTIRPQSLIGETFADCSPGTFNQPKLKTIPDGQKGAGQHLLPVQNTSSPVDIDLINNIYREPIRQRLAIILNEFGAGLAGRGSDLNDVIHRANPALAETDKVLAVLAKQNRTLADLAKSSDQVLAPLAAKRDRFAHFIVAANQTNQATAARRGDIQASIERFPAFLRQLEPTLRDLGGLADQMTPVVTDLGKAAPGINRFIEQLGPFSQASIPALESLGDATDVGRPALIAARPVVNDLRQFGTYANPVSVNLDKLTKSLKDTKGIDLFMDNIFYTMTAINGFDAVSHYLRAALIVNTCATYQAAAVVSPGCSAKWADEGASTSAAAASVASAKDHGTPPSKSLLSRILSFSSTPSGSGLDAERQAAIQRVQQGSGSDSSQALGANDPVLKYLLGN